MCYNTSDNNLQNHNQKKSLLFISIADSKFENYIIDILQNQFEVTHSYDQLLTEAPDLILVDVQRLKELEPEIQKAKEKAASVFLPLVVFVENPREHIPEYVLDFADEMIPVPTPDEILHVRIKTVLKSRNYCLELNRNYEELEKKNQQLNLYADAINATTSGITITEVRDDENPIVFCNDAF